MSNMCTNHPDKKALSICHSCKKYYCASCLDEGKEYYYCHDEKCQSMKREEQDNYIEHEKEKNSKEIAIEKSFKGNFFKDAFLYFCICIPIYFCSLVLISDPAFNSFWILLFFTVIALGKSFIANSILGFVLYKLFYNTDSIRKFKYNGLIISIISFVVFIMSMNKIKDSDMTNNGIYILSFIVVLITYLLFIIIHPKIIRVKNNKRKEIL